MIRGHTERAAPQFVIAAQRLYARSRRVDQVLDDGCRDVVAVQRRLQRALVSAGSRLEPVALAHAVVQGRVRVQAGLVDLVQGGECGGAIRLLAPRRQDRAVLPVRDRDLLAVRERDRSKVRIRSRERRIRVARRRRQAARERHQPLARLVEHVFLLPVEILDGETIEREIRVVVHPLPDRVERNQEQLGAEPRLRLLPFGEKNLDLLAPRVHAVVALIFVVPERGEIPDAIRQLPEGLGEAERGKQAFGPLRQRALQRRIPVDPRVELLVARLPLLPALKDVRQIPLVAVIDVSAIAAACRLGCGGFRGMEEVTGLHRSYRIRVRWKLPVRLPAADCLAALQ